jgi:predicted ATPase
VLRRVEVQRFRSLRYVEQDVARFQPLFGATGSGKAAFLDVIAFTSDLVRAGLDRALFGEPDAPGGRARTPRELLFERIAESFEIALEMEIPAELRTALGDDLAVVRYELEIAAIGSGDDAEIRLETIWLRPFEHASKVQGTLFPVDPPPRDPLLYTRGPAPDGWRKVLSRTADKANVHVVAEAGTWHATQRFAPNRTVLAQLPEDLTRFPASLALRRLLTERVARLRLASNEVIAGRPRLGARLDPLAPDLVRAVETALREESPTLVLANRCIAAALPWVKRVGVVERGRERQQTLALIGHDDTARPLELESPTTARFVALALAAALSPSEHVLLLEAPDAGLSDRALRALLDLCRREAAPQIVLTCAGGPINHALSDAQPIHFWRDARGASRASRLAPSDAAPA